MEFIIFYSISYLPEMSPRKFWKSSTTSGGDTIFAILQRDSIMISPFIPEDMTFAQYETQTVWGTVSCKWEKVGNTIIFDVDIPFSAKATFSFRECRRKLRPGHHRIVVEKL